MLLSNLDILVIIAYLFLMLSFGLWYSIKAKTSLSSFFLSSRNLPWWLAGTSMVATTFAADTPLWVSGQVAKNGISANWLWWSMAAGALLTVFFFARLWRRAEVLTDLEFIELRYSGKPASFLRGFRALYTGCFLNCIVLAWVNLALLRICKVLLPEYNASLILIGALLFTFLYSSLGGLRGITVTDAFQFFLALGACILLVFFADQKLILETGHTLRDSLASSYFNFFPSLDLDGKGGNEVGNFSLAWQDFLVYVGILWWSAWYPGSEPGGGGYITQRILSARDEKQGLLASLWFVIAHYCLRSWPWILAALLALSFYPNLEGTDQELGFVYLIRDSLPSPWKGLLFVAFLGAYMSTISTHLNWGSSYFINDFYKRFLKKEATDTHYIQVSRLFQLFLALLSISIALYGLQSIAGAWSFLLECTAGLGFVLILRWYWWRITAYAEIVAMIVPSLCLIWLDIPAPRSLFVLVPITISAVLLVIYLGPQEEKSHLKKFYNKILPLGRGWYTISQESRSGLFRLFLSWLVSLVLVYAFLFFIGSLFFGSAISIFIYLGLFLISSIILFFLLKKEFQNVHSL